MFRHDTALKVAIIFLPVCVLWVAPEADSIAATPGSHRIKIAIYADEGATPNDVRELQKCLPEGKGFHAVPITAKAIREGDLGKFDVLIHPGGSGSKQGTTLGEEGRKCIRKFVSEGGGFIGICAGAYLGSAQYPWSLGLLNARVIDGAHWARGQGDVQLRISAAGQAALGTEQETCKIHFENGPLLGPGKRSDLGDYELLATFETELTENGAASGVMKGTAAIARGNFGKGRVVCFSPHPEKTPGREPLLQSAIRWAAAVPVTKVSHEIQSQGGASQ